MAAQGLAAEPHSCIAIEDSILGVRSAVAAGMTVVGLTAGSHCGDGHADRLRLEGAHAIAQSYDAVAAYISRL